MKDQLVLIATLRIDAEEMAFTDSQSHFITINSFKEEATIKALHMLGWTPPPRHRPNVFKRVIRAIKG